MKGLMLLALLGMTLNAVATDFGYLKKEDQQYYKNDNMEGMNKQERLDSTVKEINKVYGEMAAMKAEIEKLKAEVAELKNSKK